MFFLIVAQATSNFIATEDLEKAIKRQTTLITKAIGSFNTNILDDRGPTTSYDSLESAGATYLSDVVARFACERRDIHHAYGE